MEPTGDYLVLTHFEAMTAFAFLVSVVFAFLSQETRRDRTVYFFRTFGLFLATGIGLGWLMYWFP